ncbi:cobalt-precorrin-5B (C(1))-methyltransferase CbiD [Gloeocapsopsis dulcis]|uniref:Cobalt-precorrin-5B C(1)-methyltransferase n=1 Tax=Gloeocapsopsis dulcis AAB1 = 1H9 TaxID=1433147 RepID=A0A6N8FUM4_9CHRO|nr:cobalt-precorrin-5B (C(1))-methyltransferase CbiD [Gloeocapsopsis dulcis]MUL36474.1 cobalt-precorrin-5B (C(1))-methyltransferase [Gloeocapsopsis dulcis AAB1 = 1H9]WNN87762.1 cobalt-precorrin-5B (C(1))-methyltransferase CbiD [Gloeocapsopsis dulcis]
MNPGQLLSGYTLPVFACAAAIAALHWLHKKQVMTSVDVNLIYPAEIVEIPIEQVSGIHQGALAITRSDPGDNLDLTRNTPIWALVEQCDREGQAIAIRGGEGIGKLSTTGEAAIYSYAQQLLQENLTQLLQPGEKITVTIILPEGKQLAERTSNAAFGVVEGLSLLGTTGIAQPLSAPGQLEAFREELQTKRHFDCLVFCIGENGLDLATRLGIDTHRLVKTANWLGPLLVEAAVQQVAAILLFGYHGKLMKLAGGIFHTHHHLADGRREILTAYAANVGLPTPVLQTLFTSSTAEAALKYLREVDIQEGSNWVNLVYGAIAHSIDQRAQEYIFKQCTRQLQVGSVLFDRDRQIIVKSEIGSTLLTHLC